MLGRIFLIGLLVLVPGVSFGATLAERIAQLSNDSDVLEATQVEEDIVPIGFGNLHKVHVRYVYTDGDVARDNTVLLIGNGDETGNWYWAVREPDVLRDVPAPAQVATEAQILQYIAMTYSALSPTGVQVLEIGADYANVALYVPVTEGETTYRERRKYQLFRDAQDNIVAQEIRETAEAPGV